MTSLQELKLQAAQAALPYIKSGMRLGLGSGTTAEEFVKLLGSEVSNGSIKDLACVPTSSRTAELASSLRLNLVTLEDCPDLDLLVDGADEIDDHLNMIKGGGGALLREKIVASRSRNVLIIADDTKLVSCLGLFPVPIEVVSFGLGVTCTAIRRVFEDFNLSGRLVLREYRTGQALITDEGHYIVDASLTKIDRDLDSLSLALTGIPGVVEHGLFVNTATLAIIVGEKGVYRLSRQDGKLDF